MADAGRKEGYLFRKSEVAVERYINRRAEKQAAFFLPYLEPGMSLIDCGCGPGTITAGLAAIVSPGKVIGFDSGDDNIRLAQDFATEQEAHNVEFRVADIHEIPFPDGSFDAAFIHNVLEHLSDPIDALAEVRRVLKPGGVLGVRDVDLDGFIYWPTNPILDRYLEVFIENWKLGSGDPTMGKRLRSLITEAGFGKVSGSATYDTYGTPESVKAFCENAAKQALAPDFVERVTKTELLNKSDLEEVAEAFLTLSKNTEAFLANGHCEAVGWKE